MRIQKITVNCYMKMQVDRIGKELAEGIVPSMLYEVNAVTIITKCS